jgi:hypothetical protein
MHFLRSDLRQTYVSDIQAAETVGSVRLMPRDEQDALTSCVGRKEAAHCTAKPAGAATLRASDATRARQGTEGPRLQPRSATALPTAAVRAAQRTTPEPIGLGGHDLA